MEINRRAVLGGAAVLAGMAATAAEAKTSKSGGGRAEAKALSAIEAYMEQHRADWGLPGITFCVVDRTGFTGYATSGLADVDKRLPVGPDHLFQIGSISKMVGALAIWSLIDEGKLSPEAKLKDLLPEISVKDGADITLQNLLNHTSGIADDPPLFPEGGLWLGYAPGSHWSYSNTGYRLIGLIGALAAGKPFMDAIEERVLTPLGMTGSVAGLRVADRPRYAQGYEPALTDRANLRPGPMTATPWVDSDSAAGSVAATAHDMAIFLRFMLGLAQGKGGPVLTDASASRFLADPADAPDWAKDAKYGNGVAHVVIDGRTYLHHTGGMVSFSSSMHVDPEAGVAAFASANVHYGLSYRPRDVTVYACQLFRSLRENSEAPKPKPTKPSIEKPEIFAGVFTAENGDSFELVAKDDYVFMRRGDRDSDMQMAGEGLFACSEPDFAVTGLKVDLDKGAAMRAWAGDVEYAVNPSAGYRPPASKELQALAGRYDNDDRWAGPVYIYARDGGLWINNIVPLAPMKNGEWRIGAEDWGPGRARFDGVVGGKAQRVMLSGVAYMRRFT